MRGAHRSGSGFRLEIIQIGFCAFFRSEIRDVIGRQEEGEGIEYGCILPPGCRAGLCCFINRQPADIFVQFLIIFRILLKLKLEELLFLYYQLNSSTIFKISGRERAFLICGGER